ncbi:MAG TPA: hypothetical protein VNT56_09290 [Acidimicrobiales bacterium]|nr:hypothetical protein [Acidimicrobiales bacterium]
MTPPRPDDTPELSPNGAPADSPDAPAPAPAAAVMSIGVPRATEASPPA